MTREELLDALHKSMVKVVFKKVDGSIRTMECTLIDEFLPEGEGASKRKPNPNVIPVWDLEADSWRSFRVDSIISVETIDV